MSEYMKDAGHRTMQTCDRCYGAFYCGAPDSADAPDWKCPMCVESEAEIARLRAALKPFAELARATVVWAATQNLGDGYILRADERGITPSFSVSDCRAALKALGEES